MKISFPRWISILVAAAALHVTIPAVVNAHTTGKFPQEFDEKFIIDITHPVDNNTPSFGSAVGSGQIINETSGNSAVTGSFRIGTHLGTHVDCPSHIYMELLDQGFTADNLDLTTLIGPVMVYKIPTGTNITAAALSSLNITKAVKRAIFLTENTDRKLMDQLAFAADYIGFTEDGANYVVNSTEIKLVGVDYMSVARSAEIVPVHKILLEKTRGIIPVENLKLDEVKPGPYIIVCLPLRLKAEAAPVRCILLKQ